MSRPDNTPQIAVDFSGPSPAPRRGRRQLIFIAVVVLTVGALFLGVTQLLLR